MVEIGGGLKDEQEVDLKTLEKLDSEETKDLILWGAITLEKWKPVAKQRIQIYRQGGPSRANLNEVEKSKKKR
ncbi:hypothetical protein AAC387_Pa08g1935 [Persea americana]